MIKFFVVMCWVIVSVSARPDVSLGYHYNPDYNSGSSLLAPPPPVQSTSYYPTASGPDLNQGSGYDVGTSLSSAVGGVGAVNFLTPNYNAATVPSSASNYNGFSSSAGGIGVRASFGQAFTGAIGQGIDQQYQAPQYQQQQPIITKHFYIHSAPEDHDNQEVVRYITIGPPRKNYNVVFINAPSSTSTKAKIIANVAPVEDQTAIYVLAKKENDLDISTDVVTPPPTAPNKPEVFFVKYKTAEEAIHAQHVIQAQYDKLGGSSDISNEGNIPVQSVIGSLGGQTNVASSSSAQSSASQNVGFQQIGNVQQNQVQQNQVQQNQVQQNQVQQNQVQQIVNSRPQPQPTYLPPRLYRRRRYYTYRY